MKIEKNTNSSSFLLSIPLWFLRFTSILIIALGLCLIVIFFILELKTNQFVSQGATQKQILCWIIMIFGVIFIVIGGMSLMVISKQKNWILYFQMTCSILLILAFITIAALITFYGNLQWDQLNPEVDALACMKNKTLNNITHYINLASFMFCREKCPCNANKSSFPNLTQIILWTSAEGPQFVQDCPVFKQLLEDLVPYAFLFQLIEEQFNCSGICNVLPYHVFADVRLGVPDDRCGSKIIVQYQKAYTIGYCIAALLIINLAFCLWIFCKQKKEKSSNVYQPVSPLKLEEPPSASSLDNLRL